MTTFRVIAVHFLVLNLVHLKSAASGAKSFGIWCGDRLEVCYAAC